MGVLVPISELINKLGWNNLVNELKEILKRLNGSISNTKQIDVTGDITLDDNYNNAIIKLKKSGKVFIPDNLKDEWSAVYRTYEGVTTQFVNVDAVQMDAPKGMFLGEFKMATMYKDGSENIVVLEGELTQS